MKFKTLKLIIDNCRKTTYLDQTIFLLDNKDYHLTATLTDKLISYDVYIGEEKIELTEAQEIFLENSMLEYKESQLDDSAFTDSDYSHFESLIYS